MAAWKRAGTCSLRLSPVFTLAVSLACSPAPSLPHMDKQIHVQVAALALSLFLTCFATVRVLSVHLSTVPPSLLSSSPPPCVCLCSSSSSCLIFLETNYRALQEEKKPEGEQFRQRASRFLPSHFHEDLFFSLQDLFFSLTSLSLFHSLYICLCPSLIYIPLFSALFLFFFFIPLKSIT